MLTATLRRVNLEQLSMVTVNIHKISILVVLLVLESAPHGGKKQRTRRILNPAEKGRSPSVQESDQLAITSTKSTDGSSGCTVTFGAKNLAILQRVLVTVP